MPSSTSSSSAAPPAGRWGRTWLLTAALVVSALGAWEGFWRLRGFTPTLGSDADLWLLAREQVARRANPVVLLGSSRIRCGLDLDVLARGLRGDKPVQLAIDACTPVPVLEQLAADESFAGLVLCGFTPTTFFAAGPPATEPVRERLHSYEKQPPSPAERLERELRLWCEDRLVFLLPQLSGASLFASLQDGRIPVQNFAAVRYDRLRQADFRRADLPDVRRQIEHWAETCEVLEPTEVPAFVAEVQESVRRIQARGGNVVFVRMPSTGRVREIERRRVPRARYWDRLVAGTTAEAIHFEDFPELARFPCPEGSHLDFRDAPAFTASFADVLSRTLSRPVAWRSALGGHSILEP